MKALRPPPADPPALAVREKVVPARRELTEALIEREDEVDLVLTALIAHEHVRLVGPPGSAKSLLLDRVLRWTGGSKFAILLTKCTAPDEVFGPVSLAALEEDRDVRVTTGKRPEGDDCFVDEVREASSAILNTLLKILNERVYDAGDGIVRTVPFLMCVAASNEWPSPDTGEEWSAVFDRFTLRTAVAPIRSQAGRQRRLWARGHTPKFTSTITPVEVAHARRPAAARPRAAAARDALETILRALAREGVQPGDMRQFKTVGGGGRSTPTRG